MTSSLPICFTTTSSSCSVDHVVVCIGRFVQLVMESQTLGIARYTFFDRSEVEVNKRIKLLEVGGIQL